MNIIEIAALVTASAAIVGLMFQQKQLKQAQATLRTQLDSSHTEFVKTLTANHLQARREVALNLWDKWESIHENKNRTRLLNFLKWIEIETDIEIKNQWIDFFVRGSRVSRETFRNTKMPEKMKEMFLAKNGDKITIEEIEAIRTALFNELNIMEKVAVAYQHEVADRNILNYAFKVTIVIQTTEFELLIDRVRDVTNNSQAWMPLTDLVFDGDWKKVKKQVKSYDSADANALKS